MNSKNTKIASAYGLSDKHTTAYLLMTIVSMQCDFSRLLKNSNGQQKKICLNGYIKAQNITREFLPLFEEINCVDILQNAAESQGLEPYWHILLDTVPENLASEINVHHSTHTVNS